MKELTRVWELVVERPKSSPLRMEYIKDVTLPLSFCYSFRRIDGSIQEDIPWCMMFSNDIVLIDEAKGAESKLEYEDELWKQDGIFGV